MTPFELEHPERLALFLDFDGTLVEIAEKPDAVQLAETTRETLTRLQRSLGGALAIVTGRDIEMIDAMLAPFRCPVAGVHGLTRRDALGRAHGAMVESNFLDEAERRLQQLARTEVGLLVERKSHAIAIHYRSRADLEHMCLEVMEGIARLDDRVRLVRGKMVIEARPTGGDKGMAVADFMMEAPFAGRRPLFAGDDVTDEDAFEVVNRRGGLTLKIGPGETRAQHRIANTASFLAWLAEMADALEKGNAID
jgi:trehalose 6-phosphate phosphatase